MDRFYKFFFSAIVSLGHLFNWTLFDLWHFVWILLCLQRLSSSSHRALAKHTQCNINVGSLICNATQHGSPWNSRIICPGTNIPQCPINASSPIDTSGPIKSNHNESGGGNWNARIGHHWIHQIEGYWSTLLWVHGQCGASSVRPSVYLSPWPLPFPF